MIMAQLIKSVLKQDLNFLNYPIWFQVSRANAELNWRENGYTYTAAYRAPDQVDMLFLMYILMQSQQTDYASQLEFSRYGILKGCACPINPQYLRRLEDSLKRWSQVSLDFKDCFYDGQNEVSRHFQILDSYKIREQDRRLELQLNADFLSQIKHSAHFKYLDFNYYRLLRRPVSRRLHELLTCTFKNSQQWSLPLTDLGRKLTLYSRRTRERNGQSEEVIYPSDVLTAVKAALDEMNHFSTDADTLRDLGMDPKEIYAVTYEVDEKKKQIAFHRAPLSHLFDKLTQESNLQDQVELYEEPRLEELLGFLKRHSRPLRELTVRYYRSHGYDYVKWNIFYANRNGARNYVSYLKLCLQHNWAQEFREEYERMFDSVEQSLDERKLAALIKVAEQADHLLMPDGKRFRIKRVFPNGALEISNRSFKMDFVLSPSQAYSCRFERENPEQHTVRKRKSSKP